MKMKKLLFTAAAALAIAASADPAASREAILRNQAYAEMQRVSSQIDSLQADHDALAAKVARMESGSGELGKIRAEIDAVKADIASLRTEMRNMRSEITADLTKRISAMMREMAPKAQPQPQPKPVNQGPMVEYTVVSGDTLSLISAASGASVGEIRRINNLKNDNLRIGQKLLLPKK